MKAIKYKKQKDFYIVQIHRIIFIYIVNCEHRNNRFLEFWQADYGKALILGSHGIGVGLIPK